MQSLGFSFLQGTDEDKDNYKKKKITNSDLKKTRKNNASNSVTKKKLLKLVESMSNKLGDESDDESNQHIAKMRNNLGKLLPPPSLQTRKAEKHYDSDDEDHDLEEDEMEMQQDKQLSNEVSPSNGKHLEGFDPAYTQNGKTNSIMSTNKLGFEQYIPNIQSMTMNHEILHGTKDELLEKLNYMIHLLEDQQDEKTGHVTEELILYCFLGVFVIFVVDSFARAGKYVR